MSTLSAPYPYRWLRRRVRRLFRRLLDIVRDDRPRRIDQLTAELQTLLRR